MAAFIGSVGANLFLESSAFNRDLGRASSALRSSSTRMNRSLARVERGWNRATMRVKSFAKSALGIRSVIGIVAGTAGLGLLVKRSLEAADSIAKTADKIGLSTDELQEYRFAAQQAGVAQQTFDMAMQRFSRRVGEAAQGQGELMATLRQYNVQVRDSHGQQRALGDVFADYAEVIRTAQSDQERLRLAFKGFDSEGAALVNMLREGVSGLEAYRQEARALGLVLNERVIRDAEKARDQLSILGNVINTRVTAAVLELTPAIGNLAEGIARSIPDLAVYVEQFARWAGLVEQISARSALAEVTQKIIELRNEIERTSNSSDFRDFLFPGARSERISDLERQMESLLERRRRLQRVITEQQLQLAGRSNIGAASTAQTTPKAQGVLESLRFEAEQIGKTNLQREISNRLRQAEVEATSAQGREIAALVTRIHDLNAAEQERQDIVARTEEVLSRRFEARMKEVEEARKAAEQREDFIAGLEMERAMVRGALDTVMLSAEQRRVELDLILLRNEAVRRGIELSAEEMARIRGILAETERMRTLFEEIRHAQEGIASTIDGALDSAMRGQIKSWEDLRQTAIDTLTDIIQHVIRLIAIQQGASGGSLGEVIAGGIVGIFSAGAGGGAIEAGTGFASRAHGGPVSAGVAYMVGERGPEPFIPDVDGFILPHGSKIAGGSGGQRPIVNQYISTPDPNGFRTNARQVARLTKRQFQVA